MITVDITQYPDAHDVSGVAITPFVR